MNQARESVNEEDVKKAIQLVILPRATITDQPDQEEQPPPPPPPPPPPSNEQEEEEEDQEEDEQENEEQEEQEQEVSPSLEVHADDVWLPLKSWTGSYHKTYPGTQQEIQKGATKAWAYIRTLSS